MKASAYAVAASLLVLQTGAAPPPKGGEDSIRIEFAVTSVEPDAPAHRDDPVSVRLEFAGVSHNEAGGAMFDNLVVRCAGRSELAGDRGDCVATDRDGDALRLSYRFPDEAGSVSTLITGGTGKFAGMSGRSQGACATLSADRGLPLFVTWQKVRWRANETARAGPASRY